MNPLNLPILAFAAVFVIVATLAFFLIGVALPGSAAVAISVIAAVAFLLGAFHYFPAQSAGAVGIVLIVIVLLLWALCLWHVLGATR